VKRKLVFLDIDGTLANRNHVPLSARRACRKARQNGHLLYICTGRARVQISPRILRMGFDGVVSSGGAYIETGGTEGEGRPLFHAAFERAFLLRLLAYFNAGQTPYFLELPGSLFAGPYLKPWFDRLYAGRPRTFRACMEKLFLRLIFRAMVPGDPPSWDGVAKVIFMEEGGVSFEDVRREFGGECELFRNSIPLADMTGGEISPRGVHKGAALEKAAAYHGIAREDTIALGDSDNDRTMLEWAGTGIAMGNAHEALKQAADDVTDPIGKAGLAKAFKKYGLI
jgi:hydroxymethylpyrimidine pyrophosphatase-like HAD family hydrolase